MTLIKHNKLLLGEFAKASTFQRISNQYELKELICCLQDCFSKFRELIAIAKKNGLEKCFTDASILFFSLVNLEKNQLPYLSNKLGINFRDMNELIAMLRVKNGLKYDLELGLRTWRVILTHSTQTLNQHEVEKLFQTIEPIKQFVDKYLYEKDD